MGTLGEGQAMKVLKTETEYTSALAELDDLLSRDPDPGTDEADRAEVLTVLIQEYEARHFPVGVPDALAAIRFRMEQQGLSQNELVPYLGSRSRVSEVMAGKRPLSLSMIRALHFGLGVPASALIQSTRDSPMEEDIAWDRFPIKEMIKRGWIRTNQVVPDNIEALLKDFFAQVTPSPAMATVYLKKDHIR